MSDPAVPASHRAWATPVRSVRLTPLRITVDRIAVASDRTRPLRVRAAHSARGPRLAAGDAGELEPTFAELLALEDVDRDIFRGRCLGAGLAYGGQMAAQAQIAANRTVPADRVVHSLHAYFLHPGRERTPIVYLVDRTRDGGSFTTRRVTAVQAGEVIFAMSVSFHGGQYGGEHQLRAPRVPGPELPQSWTGEGPHRGLIDLRVIGDARGDQQPGRDQQPGGERLSRQLAWVRFRRGLPEDQGLHACALTYLSGQTLAVAAQATYRARTRTVVPPSVDPIDHAIWFHRPFRADEWLLFVQDSPSASGARALARGTYFSADGRLIASAVQEMRAGHPGS